MKCTLLVYPQAGMYRDTWREGNQSFITVLHLSVWNMMPTLKSSCGHPLEGLIIRASIWCNSLK